jgi:RHS repeat-associated protein
MIKKGFILIWILVSGCVTFAGQGQYIKSLTGSNISADATLFFQDVFYYQYIGTANQGEDFCVKNSDIHVRLRYDQLENKSTLDTDFSVRVVYDVLLYKNDYSNPITITQRQLYIQHFGSEGVQPYNDIDMDVYDDAIYIGATVKVKSIEALDGSGNSITVPVDVSLDVIQDLERVFELNQAVSSAPVIVKDYVGFGSDQYGNKNEVHLTWNGVQGAESYDVEWLYINTGTESDLTKFDIDFSKATRINTDQSEYKISLIYPKGELLYRVRARGLDESLFCSSNGVVKKEITGAWSSEKYATDAAFFASSDHIPLSGYAKYYNWTYGVNYAEGGKVVENMGFYDGTLRNRQNVTSFKADQNVVISETLYDHDGRAVVSIAPVPVTSEGMKFYKKNVNTSIHGSFDRTNFNTDTHLGSAVPEGLSTTDSWSSAYFSSNNSSTSDFRDFIPSAGGYAYSQVFYTNDGTNRMKAQSALGEDFHINSGNESRSYYVNTNQGELNRLFGSEVGAASHYRKVITKDANGQYSVAYLDFQGRTIASALTGDAPKTSSNNKILLDADGKATPFTVSNMDLLAGGQQELSDGSYQKKHTFAIIPGNGLPTFNYSVTGIQSSAACSQNIDTKYDVQMYIEDEFGNLKLSINPSPTSSNPVLGPMTTAVLGSSDSYTNNLVPILNEGSYTLVKKINVNEGYLDTKQAALETQLEADMTSYLAYWEDRLKAFYDPDYTSNSATAPSSACITMAMPEVDPCDESCANACENDYREAYYNTTSNLIEYKYYYNNAGVRTLDPDQTNHTNYNTTVNNCVSDSCSDKGQGISRVSECDNRKNKMLQDLSPGGQYFDNTPKKYVVNNVTGVFEDADGNRVENTSYSTDINVWLNSQTVSASTVTGGSYTTWNDVRANWDDSYALALLSSHPEYTYYQFHCINGVITMGTNDSKPATTDVSMSTINAYHDKMNAGVSSYQDGSTNYYMAMPFGGNEQLNFSLPQNYISDLTNNNVSNGTKDPLFTSSHVYGANYVDVKGKILTKLQNFVKVSSGVYHSIWYVLDRPHYAPGVSTAGWSVEALALYKSIHGTTATSNDGVLDLGMTKQEYFRSVYDYHRQYFIYQYFKYNHYSTGSSPWTLDKNHTGNIQDFSATHPWSTGTTEDDYRLHNLENPMYAGVYAGAFANNFATYDPVLGTMAVSNPTTGSTAMNPEFVNYNNELLYQASVGTASQWMMQLDDDGWITSGVNVAELRTNLVTLCHNGGLQAKSALQAHYFQTATLTDALRDKYSIAQSSGMSDLITDISLTALGTSYSNISDANELIKKYITTFPGSLADIDYPSVPANGIAFSSPMDCNCGEIQSQYTGSNYNTDPNGGNFTAIATNIKTNLVNNLSITVSVDQVKAWLTVCHNNQGTFVPDASNSSQTSWITFPNDLECKPCKCDAFKSVITENGGDLGSVDNDDATLLSGLFGYSISVAEINTILTKCNNSSGGSFSKFPESLRCLGSPVVDEKKACINDAIQMAMNNAEAAYRKEIEDKLLNFKADLKSDLLDNMTSRETLTKTYNINEYYYTLYYYDQAGNLVKTVPPEGVKPIGLQDAVTGLTIPSACTNCTTKSRLINYVRWNDAGTSYYVYPDHKLVTRYSYNSFNQLSEQNTPDGGKSNFWYDQIDRLTISRNAEQNYNGNHATDKKYSYTHYDDLGRIKEVGQITNAVVMTDEKSYDKTQRDVWYSTTANGTKEQVTITVYDGAVDDQHDELAQMGFIPSNLRNRVTASFFFENNPISKPNVNDNLKSATYYSYDIHGNVNSLVQQNNDLKLGNGIKGHLKKVDYKYDLLSGNVNEVAYQDGEVDQFYHKYYYDANNRLIETYTSRDHYIWEKQSKYFYYQHGPLARVEIGDKKVQAQDYAYTINGWLKGVNSGTLDANRDLGKDGKYSNTNLNKYVAQDAYGYTLSYYDQDKYESAKKDYKSIGNTSGFEPTFDHSNTWKDQTFASGSANGLSGERVYASLYNGNISRMVVALQDHSQNDIAVHNNTYRYDQLNRIKAATVYQNMDASGNDQLASSNNLIGLNHNSWSYAAQYDYDRNGNLKHLNRNGVLNAAQSSVVNMDKLTYSYNYDSNSRLNNNKLKKVSDIVSYTGNYTNDIDNQSATDNYSYDKIGNLVSDDSEQIEKIEWTVSGKVKSITRSIPSTKPDLEFTYDPQGNRISKIVKPRNASGSSEEAAWVTTTYVRDATGNVLANYNRKYDGGCSITILIPFNNKVVTQVGIGSDNLVFSSPVSNIDVLLNQILNHFPNITGYISDDQLVLTNSSSNCSSESMNIHYTPVGDNAGSSYVTNYSFNSGDQYETVRLTDNNIYGSSRLGVYNRNKEVRNIKFEGNISNMTNIIEYKEISPSVTDAVGITNINGEITNIATVQDWNYSGGASIEKIPADGYVERTIGGSDISLNHRGFAGLSYINVDASYISVDYGIYAQNNGVLYIWQNGGFINTSITYGLGDVLRVSREGNRIKYYHNGSNIGDYAEKPAGIGLPLVCDFALLNLGSKLYNLKMGGTSFLNYNNTIQRTLGTARYELVNHLGNVMSVVSDRKIIDTEGTEIERSLFDQEVVYSEDFNDGTVGGFGPWYYGGTIAFENHANQLKFACNSTAGSIVKNVSIENGKNYELAFNVDFQGGSNNIRVVLFDKNYNKFFEKEFTSMSDGIIRVPFKGQSDLVRIVIHSNYYGPNSYLLDNFQLLKSDMGGWQTLDQYYDSKIINGRVEVKSNYKYQWGMRKELHDMVPGHQYKFTVNADFCNGTAKPWRVFAYDLDNSNFIGYSQVFIQGKNSFMFTAGSKNVLFKLELLDENYTGGSNYTYICLDNISIVDVTQKQYIADVISTSDYYAFGSQMPQRSFTSTEYDYGFNGMEKDNEVKGSGNSLDYVARMYDPRLGRFLSTDPLMSQNATWTPYGYALDNPIMFVDDNGEWPGVTFMFLELDAGVGFIYGINHIRQSGVARDEVGKTHFIMVSEVFVDPGEDGAILLMGGVSATGILRQSWKKETFAGLLGSSGWSFTIDAALGVGLTAGVGDSEFSVGAGIGLAARIQASTTSVLESISLTWDQADKVNEQSSGSSSWGVSGASEKPNEDNYFEAFVTIGVGDDKVITDQKVYSLDGKTWMSQQYRTEAKEAEAN